MESLQGADVKGRKIREWTPAILLAAYTSTMAWDRAT